MHCGYGRDTREFGSKRYECAKYCLYAQSWKRPHEQRSSSFNTILYCNINFTLMYYLILSITIYTIKSQLVL